MRPAKLQPLVSVFRRDCRSSEVISTVVADPVVECRGHTGDDGAVGHHGRTSSSDLHPARPGRGRGRLCGDVPDVWRRLQLFGVFRFAAAGLCCVAGRGRVQLSRSPSRYTISSARSVARLPIGSAPAPRAFSELPARFGPDFRRGRNCAVAGLCRLRTGARRRNRLFLCPGDRCRTALVMCTTAALHRVSPCPVLDSERLLCPRSRRC